MIIFIKFLKFGNHLSTKQNGFSRILIKKRKKLPSLQIASSQLFENKCFNFVLISILQLSINVKIVEYKNVHTKTKQSYVNIGFEDLFLLSVSKKRRLLKNDWKNLSSKNCVCTIWVRDENNIIWSHIAYMKELQNIEQII